MILKYVSKQIALNKHIFMIRCGSGDFFNFVNVLSLFHYYLPLEKGVALTCINLNTLHPRMLCAKIGWKLTDSGEEDFVKSCY